MKQALEILFLALWADQRTFSQVTRVKSLSISVSGTNIRTHGSKTSIYSINRSIVKLEALR